METIIGNKNKIITSLLNLEEEKIYKVEVKLFKDKKTLKQNNYMWELINQIARKQYMDEMDIYCQVLQEANVKYIWLKGFPETKEELLKSFRAVQITRYEDDNNKKLAIFKCYLGTSKFDKGEMVELLNIVISWAEELGIPTLREEELI